MGVTYDNEQFPNGWHLLAVAWASDIMGGTCRGDLEKQESTSDLLCQIVVFLPHTGKYGQVRMFKAVLSTASKAFLAVVKKC